MSGPPTERNALLRMIKPALALGGAALGAVLVWLSFRDTDYAAVSQAFGNADLVKLALASLVYFGAIFVRIVRWQVLLKELGSVSFRKVARALIVGFAMNFALPGRLGEIFRADVVKEVTSVSRASALGAIMIERALDGLMLLALLAGSLMVLYLGNSGASGISLVFMLTAGVIFFGATLAILVLRRVNLTGLGFVSALFERFRAGLRALSRRNIGVFAGASVLVAMLEMLAIGLALSALGLEAGLVSSALVLSVASLSTLLPTAPAYLGSYQFAFVLAFSALNWPSAPAVAAAFLVQLAFFVPIMIVGFGFAVQTYSRQLFGVRSSHQDRA